MKKTTTELWLTVSAWLNRCNIRVDRSFLKEEISTHPDYPSLLSVIDFLDSGNMSYRAIRSDLTNATHFNYPLLAHIKDPGHQYLQLIDDVSGWADTEVVGNWSGILLYPEKDAAWQNPENAKAISDRRRRRASGIVIGLAAIIAWIIAASFISSLSLRWFGSLSLAGLFISLLALGTELGFENRLVKQVCGAVGSKIGGGGRKTGSGAKTGGGGSKTGGGKAGRSNSVSTNGAGGCESVLKSGFAKGIGGVSPSEISVIYFATQFVMMLFNPLNPTLAALSVFVSIGGLLIGAVSIYLQAFTLRQWCALCLGIVAVMTAQAIIALVEMPLLIHALAVPLMPGTFPIKLIVVDLLLIAGAWLIIGLAVSSIKELLRTTKDNRIKLAELRKWKMDAGLFVNQWKQEVLVDTTVWSVHDLLLGERDAALTLLVACNPYCNPCAKTHAQLHRMLQQHAGRFHMLVRLTANTADTTDRRWIAVQGILQVAAGIDDPHARAEMLHDWFEWMDFERWSAKWQPDRGVATEQLMQQHADWMEESRIAHTPTIFINGRRVPGRYTLDDLEKLLPQLGDLLETAEPAACLNDAS